MTARQIGDVVHLDEDWPCRSTIVLACRRRGLDLMVSKASGWVVLESVPHGKPGATGTWHRRCPDRDGGRSGQPRGHFRMRRVK
jgi:hypothetical protein